MKKWFQNAGAAALTGGAGIYFVYRKVFGRDHRSQGADHRIPRGEQYDPYAQAIRDGIREAEKLPYQRVFIEAEDKTVLSARYYSGGEKAPLIIFFHGYRSSGIRDGNGMLLFARKMGYGVLLPDQRGHGKSGGKTITFGVKERYDCLDWIHYANKRFGEERRIVLVGISMGASTVLMASDLGLPGNVKGIVADCPYSSPKEILKAVIKQRNLPVSLTYPAVKLAARIFGNFDIEEASPAEAMKRCSVPVLFIHGEEDRFVPCEMSRSCWESCTSKGKKLILVKGAAHGISYCVDKKLYEKEVTDFLEMIFV